MIARDRRQEAIDDLYGGDPADFLPRRKELAAQARAAKDRDAATAIAALRKPTRSAHLLNQLSRREPERVDALLRLTDAAGGGDGRSRRDALRAMRELTTRRRRLIDDLTERAFAGAGEESPSAALREEVVATLNAAVGDPDVGAELAEGRLVRSHEWSGFGFSAADLALVPDEPDAEDTGAEDTNAEDETDDGDTNADGAAADNDADDEDDVQDDDDGDEDTDTDTDPDEQELETDAGAEAREALRQAERDLKAQQRSERSQQDRVTELEDELAEAQIRLDEIRVGIRRAEMAVRRARAAADRADRAD